MTIEEMVLESILNGKSQSFVTDDNGVFLDRNTVIEKLEYEINNCMSNVELLNYISQAIEERLLNA